MALREFVYIDESGIHEGVSFCLVAGYRASPRQWERFNKDWRAILSRYGIKEAFHSKVFFNRQIDKDSPYRLWTDEKANAFLDELLLIVDKYKLRPVGCAVDVKAFEAYSYGERCVLVGYIPTRSRRKYRMQPAPYHLAFRHMLTDALIEAQVGTAIHFVLAEQRQLQQRAIDGYLLIKRLWSDHDYEPEKTYVRQLKGIGVEPASDFPGLQAADLLANRWYNALVHRMRVSPRDRKTMNVLARKRNDMPVCDGPSIERMFEEAGIDEVERIKLRSAVGPS